MKSGMLFLAVFVLLATCSSPPRGVIILCAGDSITAAEYPRHLQRLLKKDGLRARVLNYGQRGFTSGEYLRYLKRNKDALSEEHADFVLLQLGTNDVRLDGDNTSGEAFGSQMREIIRIFRDFKNRKGESTKIMLATIPPLPGKVNFPFGPESQARVISEINPLLVTIAAEEKLLLVDNYSLFFRSPYLLPDVHPTSEGYRALARNWYEALQTFLPKK